MRQFASRLPSWDSTSREWRPPVNFYPGWRPGGDIWSGQLDSNQRPAVPKTAALPGCAIPRSVLGNDVDTRLDRRLQGGGRPWSGPRNGPNPTLHGVVFEILSPGRPAAPQRPLNRG